MLHAGVAEQFGVGDEGMLVEATLDAVVVHGSALVVRLVLFLALKAYPGLLDDGSALWAFEIVLRARIWSALCWCKSLFCSGSFGLVLYLYFVSVQHEVDCHELLHIRPYLACRKVSGLPHVEGVAFTVPHHELEGDPALIPEEAGANDLDGQLPIPELSLLYVSPAQGGFLPRNFLYLRWTWSLVIWISPFPYLVSPFLRIWASAVYSSGRCWRPSWRSKDHRTSDGVLSDNINRFVPSSIVK